jgi:Domain of unknown function (DUF4191)
MALSRRKRAAGATSAGATATGAATAKSSRIGQLRQAYRITKDGDPKIGLILLGTFVFAAVVGFALFYLIPPGWLPADILLGLMVGLLVTLIVFTRRATRSQLRQVEGKPGAALAALSVLRRQWRTDQAIAFNRNQDVVHRLVGPPGIVLVGEGNPGRVRTLLSNERRKHQRVVAETPIHEVVVGYGEGEVPLAKLSKHVSKLKREVEPGQVTDILARLKALDATRSAIPLPKGPIPTSTKGLRGNMRGR